MIQDITHRMMKVVSIVSGNGAVAMGLSYWEIIDGKNGGVWSFSQTDVTLGIAWRPTIDETTKDAFTLHFYSEKGVLHCNLDRGEDWQLVDKSRFRRLGIEMLSTILDRVKVPDCVHRELNELFMPFDKKAYMKGAMAEAGVAFEVVTEEKLVDGAWEKKEDLRLVRDIGLEHPNETVRTAFEKAERMYQGKALDDQKDPSKLN